MVRNEKPAYAETASAGEVGVARFELTTSWSQTKRDTGLRYTPNIWEREYQRNISNFDSQPKNIHYFFQIPLKLKQ